jgi:hypothetical protein
MVFAPVPHRGIAIFSKRVSGADNPVQFILPVEPAFDEERRRVADALRTIAQIEQCPEAWVAEKVVQRADSERAYSEHASRAAPTSDPEQTTSRRREIPLRIGIARRLRVKLENEVDE